MPLSGKIIEFMELYTLKPTRVWGLSAAVVLEVVASYATCLILAVVGFEYRHRFGVGQAGMGLAEAAECFFVEVG